MKILFVIANLANGGAERVLSAISSELAKGNEIHICVIERDYELYEFAPNITFHRLNLQAGGVSVKFKKIFALRALFRRIRPDLIISFIDWTNVICVVANFGLNFKHIATEHHANEYLASPKFRLIRDFAYKRVDGLSVLSRSDFDYYTFVERREILHNPLFIATPEPSPKQNIILSVGRLEAVKGYELYFHALCKLDRQILQGWRIVIAGDGSLRQNLENLAQGLGLDIEFLGHVGDVGELYESAKIFVISSLSEGLSNVLIESGAFGCARVSSDTVGGRELITNGVDGILYHSTNSDELASALEQVLTDERLQERLGENARAKSGEFALEKIMHKWQKFIDEVTRK